jgi:hypothetical protein
MDDYIMSGDLTLEIDRDDVGRFLLKNPDASHNEIVNALLRLAKDKRQGSPGSGLVIHDQSSSDYTQDEFLKIVRHEIMTEIIRK